MSANNSYEAMMVFSVKNGEEGVPALIEKFKALWTALMSGASASSLTLSTMSPRDSTLCSISALHLSSPRSSTVSPV